MTILDTLTSIDALRSENRHLHACITRDEMVIDHALQVIAEQGNEIYALRKELAELRAGEAK